MDGYEPPIYVPLVMPMTFDAAEAQRKRDAYAEYRRERSELWHQNEAEHNVNYYRRAG